MDNILFYSTSPHDLKTLISEAVKDTILGINASVPHQEEYLTRKEVCTLLKISPVTLHDWTVKGLIKGLRINSRIRYKRSDVEKALREIGNLKYRRSGI
jgi:excisionase family DNA binding protein